MAGQKFVGANEDMFLKAFDSTPKLNIATQKRLENELARVISVISNTSADWDQRVQAMKLFRSLVNSGIADQDDFYTTTLRNLEIPFQNNICDLRSQVVRETSITIAFLSCRLQQKFSRMAEVLLPSLIKLIPNSAKIISTSALVALRFIIQSTHSSRLITIIKYQLSTSKSKEIHRALCEIAERITTLWPPQIIERQMNDFVEVLRLGICDSDELARQYARRAFNAFAENFREQADRLFNSLDGQRQRMLNNLNHGGGSTLSMNGYGGSATSGLNTLGILPAQVSSNQNSGTHRPNNQHQTASSNTNQHTIQSSGYGQQTNHSHQANFVSRLKSTLTTSNGNSPLSSSASSGSSIPPPSANHATSHVYQTTARTTASPSRIRTPTARSTSAIDEGAQRRARARAVYLNSMYQRPRQLGTINNVTPSPMKSNLPQPVINVSPGVDQLSHANHAATSSHHTIMAPSTPSSHGNSTSLFQTPQTSHKFRYGHTNDHVLSNSTNKVVHQHYQPAASGDQRTSPNLYQSSKHQPQQEAQESEKTNGDALSRAAVYLNSAIRDTSADESQIVTTIKYFNTLIEKHSSEVVKQLLAELMQPLTVGIDNSAISVRKATVFAMVAIYSKVGLDAMEAYLSSLTMTQRRLLEVYIRKHDEEGRKFQS